MWRDRVEQMDAVTAVLLMESSMGKMFGEISVLKSCFQPDLDSEFPKIEADVLHKLGLGPDPEEAAAAAAAATAAAAAAAHVHAHAHAAAHAPAAPIAPAVHGGGHPLGGGGGWSGGGGGGSGAGSGGGGWWCGGGGGLVCGDGFGRSATFEANADFGGGGAGGGAHLDLGGRGAGGGVGGGGGGGAHLGGGGAPPSQPPMHAAAGAAHAGRGPLYSQFGSEPPYMSGHARASQQHPRPPYGGGDGPSQQPPPYPGGGGASQNPPPPFGHARGAQPRPAATSQSGSQGLPMVGLADRSPSNCWTPTAGPPEKRRRLAAEFIDSYVEPGGWGS